MTPNKIGGKNNFGRNEPGKGSFLTFQTIEPTRGSDFLCRPYPPMKFGVMNI